MQKRNLKAVLFDMDGVLYDSMPNHAYAWTTIMQARGLHLTHEEVYLHEGRTGADTIHIVCKRQQREITHEEIQAIYKEKSELFNTFPPVDKMPGSHELLQKVVRDNLIPMLVTGSGQPSLLNRLNDSFPQIFRRERMVTPFDVTRGKPHPDPYLMALEK